MSQPMPGAPAALSPMVVDTDVVSYIFKRDTRAAGYEPHLIGISPALMTGQLVAEWITTGRTAIPLAAFAP